MFNNTHLRHVIRNHHYEAAATKQHFILSNIAPILTVQLDCLSEKRKPIKWKGCNGAKVI